jgi:YD repeat-containing protein
LPELDKNGGTCSGNYVGMPIDVSKGVKLETYPLFSLPGEMGLEYTLYYNTSPLYSWFSNFDYSIATAVLCEQGTQLTCTVVSRPDGSLLKFYGGPKSTTYRSVVGSVATLTRDVGTGNYTFRDENATTQVYSSAGKILSITNASGISWTFSYNTNGYRVTHTNGTFVNVIDGPIVSTAALGGGYYTSQVTTIKDPAGNAYVITRDNGMVSNGEREVASIALPGTPATTLSFKYKSYGPSSERTATSLMTEMDINGAPYSYTSYVEDASSPYYMWANATYFADGSNLVSVLYGTDGQGHLTGIVTNPLGHSAKNTYAGINGQLTSVGNDAVASCGATIASRAYDSNGNLTQTVDNNGNLHTYRYAANGQLQTETEAAGTSIARTTNYVWDPNGQLNRLLSVTVEGLKRTAYSYNERNRIASVAVTNLSSNGYTNETLTTTYNYAYYGNGMVQTMWVTRPSPNGSDTVIR